MVEWKEQIFLIIHRFIDSQTHKALGRKKRLNAYASYGIHKMHKTFGGKERSNACGSHIMV